jgi:putative restriction endonuclease
VSGALLRSGGWTRDQLIIAFNLYCKIPFGRIHYRNPEIIALAKAIGRTPSAVSWKLANFASLDPSLKSRDISGATHGAKAEREIWDEFNGDWERLAYESEKLMTAVQHAEAVVDESLFPEGKSREAIVRVRVNQAFFRSAVLAAYDLRCCITGLAVPELLNASHIVPWRVDQKNRTNPRNGLCLNATHDRAFDCGLITVTEDYRVKLLPLIKRVKGDALKTLFLHYENCPVTTPIRFRPDPAFLRYHNQEVFRES